MNTPISLAGAPATSPLLAAVVTDVIESERVGFASLSLLNFLGGLLFVRVKEEKAQVAQIL